MRSNFPLTIAIDVDGVLLDLMATWLERLYKKTGFRLLPSQTTNWNIEEQVPVEHRTTFSGLLDSSIYDSVQPVRDASNGVYELAKMGHTLILVTSCDRARIASKMRCIRRYFPNVFSGVVVATDKSCVAYDILIDDGVHNAPTILFDAPWNHWNTDPCAYSVRAFNWKDVVQLVRDYGCW